MTDHEASPSGEDESVTQWFHSLKSGDEAAAERLWHRYFRRLADHARQFLSSDAVYDEQDVALSAFHSLFVAARDGRYETLGDRNELWLLLTRIAHNKSISRKRHNRAQKRGATERQAGGDEVNGATDSQPAPDLCVMMADECERFLDLLADDELREIALLRLEGYSVPEIAEQLTRGQRTIRRKLAMIRLNWQSLMDDDAPEGE